MDGWMDGGRDGWMDGWMGKGGRDGGMEGWRNGGMGRGRGRRTWTLISLTSAAAAPAAKQMHSVRPH